MAIKQPVKTIEEAFGSSCKKNDISVRVRKSSRTSMPIRDENGDVLILSEDLSIKKKATIKPVKKKEHTKLKSSAEKPEIILPLIPAGKRRNSNKNARKKQLVKT